MGYKKKIFQNHAKSSFRNVRLSIIDKGQAGNIYECMNKFWNDEIGRGTAYVIKFTKFQYSTSETVKVTGLMSSAQLQVSLNNS